MHKSYSEELLNFRIQELEDGLRETIAAHELSIRRLTDALRVLAQDGLQLANLVLPADSYEALLVRGARERAEKVLASLGAERVTH